MHNSNHTSNQRRCSPCHLQITQFQTPPLLLLAHHYYHYHDYPHYYYHHHYHRVWSLAVLPESRITLAGKLISSSSIHCISSSFSSEKVSLAICLCSALLGNPYKWIQCGHGSRLEESGALERETETFNNNIAGGEMELIDLGEEVVELKKWVAIQNNDNLSSSSSLCFSLRIIIRLHGFNGELNRLVRI